MVFLRLPEAVTACLIAFGPVLRAAEDFLGFALALAMLLTLWLLYFLLFTAVRISVSHNNPLTFYLCGLSELQS